MDNYIGNDEREQLDALYDQQIYLLKRELDKVKLLKSSLLDNIALKAAADPVVTVPVTEAYSKAMTRLYLKRREKKLLEIECRVEQEAYERKLAAIKEKLAKLEGDIKEMKETV